MRRPFSKEQGNIFHYSKNLKTKEEEDKLFKEMNEGKEENYGVLVEANLKLVAMIASKYRNSGIDFEDLIQTGTIGLMHAVKTYDYTRNNKFGTYAHWWIFHNIVNSLTSSARSIRIPNYQYENINKIRRIKSEMEMNEQKITPENIAKKTNIKLKIVKELLIIMENLGTSSLSEKTEDGLEIGDLVEDKNATTDKNLLDSERREKILIFLKKNLNDREFDIITKRFGIYGGTPITLRELSEQHKLTRETIRLSEKKALKKIKRTF